jgi:hypothetical protein
VLCTCHSFIPITLFLLSFSVLIYRTEQNRTEQNRTEQNRTEQPTTSAKPNSSVLFIMHSVHKANVFKHRNFSPFQNSKTGSGVQPAYYSMGTGGLSPGIEGGRGGKAAWTKADNSPSTTAAKFKNGWSYTATPEYVPVEYREASALHYLPHA